jgi:hypothetical protein
LLSFPSIYCYYAVRFFKKIFSAHRWTQNDVMQHSVHFSATALLFSLFFFNFFSVLLCVSLETYIYTAQRENSNFVTRLFQVFLSFPSAYNADLIYLNGKKLGSTLFCFFTTYWNFCNWVAALPLIKNMQASKSAKENDDVETKSKVSLVCVDARHFIVISWAFHFFFKKQHIALHLHTKEIRITYYLL